ncbi:MAG: biotin--[acetyl-CoA-carboxylase] ligase [Candidatus Thorarchaeota archaeon]
MDEVESTNIEAKECLMQGEGEGFIVTAKTQTSGRGRKDRNWLSPPGGLYFSIILKFPLKLENAPLLGLLGACAVARSLRLLGISNVNLKWPNDVLVGTSKIAGILSEAVAFGDTLSGIIMGIGVNQNCPVAEMPSGLQWSATSIIDELGKETSTEVLLCAIVNEIDDLLQIVENSSSFAPVLDEWKKSSSTLGSRVRIYENETFTDGFAIDIDSDGSLIVETQHGIENVLLGDVSHLRPEE